MFSSPPPGSSWVWSSLDGIMAAIALGGTVLLAAVSYFWPPRREVDKRFDRVAAGAATAKDEAARAHARIDLIVQGMQNVATREDVQKIMTRLSEQDGDRKVLAAEIASVKEALERVARPLNIIVEAALNKGAP